MIGVVFFWGYSANLTHELIKLTIGWDAETVINNLFDSLMIVVSIGDFLLDSCPFENPVILRPLIQAHHRFRGGFSEKSLVVDV